MVGSTKFPGLLQQVAADQHLAPLLAGQVERLHHVVDGARRDQRPHQRALGERITDGDLPVGLDQPLGEHVGDAAVDDEPPQRGAPLSGGAHGGEQGRRG